MNGAATAISVLVGATLVVVALRDVFRTLWQPAGEGGLSRWLSRVVWRVTGRLGPSARQVAGPALLVLVIVVWVGLVVLGGALVYLPWLTDGGFVYGSGLVPGDRAPLLDALYLSTVVLGTLGFGDIVPSDGWLRLATATQALLGFSILTAAVSWITQVQAALARRRAAARLLTAHRRATEALEARAGQAPARTGGAGSGTRPDAVPPVPGSAPSPVEPSRTLLEQVARDLAEVHVDLGQVTPSYYFRDRDGEGAMAVALPWVDELVQRSRRSARDEVRAAGAVLDVTVADLVDLLDGRFLHTGGDRADVLRRYREDQGHAV